MGSMGQNNLKEAESFFPQFWWIFGIGKITGTWPFSFTILKPKLELQIQTEGFANSKAPARSKLTIHYGFTIFYLSMTLLTFVGLPFYSYVVYPLFKSSASITNNNVTGGDGMIEGTTNTTEVVTVTGTGIQTFHVTEPAYGTDTDTTIYPTDTDDRTKTTHRLNHHLSQQVGLVFTVLVVIIGVIYLRIVNLCRAKSTRLFWVNFDGVVHEILDLYLSTPGLDHKIYKRLLRIQKIKVNIFLAIAIFGGFGVFLQTPFLDVIIGYFSQVSLPLAIFLAIVCVLLSMETFIHCVYYLIVYTIVKTMGIAFKILKIQVENLIEKQQQQEEGQDGSIPVIQGLRSKTLMRVQNSKNSRQILFEDPADAVNAANLGVDGYFNRKVATILKLASSLSDVFETFNDKFKTQMLAFFWLIGIPMIFNLFFVFIHVWELEPVRPVLGQLTSFIRNYLVFAWICNAGQEIIDVSSDIADLLGNVGIHNLSRETIHMIHFYHRRTLGKPLLISPGSYVTFNNKLMTSLYGAFVTYLAILIQFNQPHSIEVSPDV